MSAARTNSSKWMAPEIAHVMYQRALAVGILFGAVSLGLALFPATRAQFFRSYLLGFMFWLGITLGSMAFLMIQHLTGGMWGMVIRRPLEAAIKVLPLMLILFAPVVVGIPSGRRLGAGCADDLSGVACAGVVAGAVGHAVFLRGAGGRGDVGVRAPAPAVYCPGLPCRTDAAARATPVRRAAR